jgi:hypothetical protein
MLEEAGSGAAKQAAADSGFRGYRWLRPPVYVVAFSGTNGLSVAAGPRTMPRVRVRASAGRIFYGLPFRLERSTILGFFQSNLKPIVVEADAVRVERRQHYPLHLSPPIPISPSQQQRSGGPLTTDRAMQHTVTACKPPQPVAALLPSRPLLLGRTAFPFRPIPGR